MFSQSLCIPSFSINSSGAIRNLMKYASAIFLSFNFLTAQSLVEDLGGSMTEFKIISDSIELPILSQAIVWRGVKKVDKNQKEWVDSDYESAHSSAYGYGYGLRALHLEFLTTSTISKEKRKDEFGIDYLEFKLFDKDQKLLLETRTSLDRLKRRSNLADLTTYSFNLLDIPIILLDMTDSMSILYVEAEEEKRVKSKKRK